VSATVLNILSTVSLNVETFASAILLSVKFL